MLNSDYRDILRALSEINGLPGGRRIWLMRNFWRRADSPFKLEQGALFIKSARVAGELPARADDPVAGNNEGDGVMPHGPAHSLGRGPGA